MVPPNNSSSWLFLWIGIHKTNPYRFYSLGIICLLAVFILRWQSSPFFQDKLSRKVSQSAFLASNAYPIATLTDPVFSLTDPDGTLILNGDDSPSTDESTDFGVVDIDGGTESQTFTIINNGGSTLTLTGTPNIQISGSSAFSVTEQPGSNIISESGGTDHFTITFNPDNNVCGPQNAVVSIANNDTDQDPFTFHISGESNDNVTPSASCRNITTYLDASGNTTITATQIDNGTSDNCGIADTSIDITAFDCSHVGSNTVILTATDTSMNTQTCNAMVTVQDTIPPTLTCLSTIDVDLSGDGTETIIPSDLGVITNDACGEVNLSLDRNTVSLSDLDQDPFVILTATDINSNTSVCTTEINLLLADPALADDATRVIVKASNLIETGQQPAIFDPCACRDQMDSLSNGEFTNRGLFNDEIVVVSATQGDKWEITGTADSKPLPYSYTPDLGVQLEDLSSVQNGDTLVYLGSTMVGSDIRYIYSLPIIHQDSVGYSVEVKEANGKYPSFTLVTDNMCFYPDIYFDDIATGYLQSSAPLNLTGTSLNNIHATGAFLIAGDTLIKGTLPLEWTLDFSTLEAGPTELIFIVDADTAGSKNINDPGCKQKIYEPFVVSDGNFACNGQVNVNLSQQCEVELALSQLMRGRYVSSIAYLYDLTIAMDGQVLSDNLITQPGMYDYRIDGPDGFVCWGKISAEDKFPPVLESVDFTQDTFYCTDLQAILDNPQTLDPTSDIFTGIAYFRDACESDYSEIEFADRVEFGNCLDGFTAKIFRTFTAYGPEGKSADTTQVITFVVPPLDSLIQLDEAIQVQTCQADQEIAPPFWPFWINTIGDTIYINEVECGYGISVDSTVFPICSNQGRKIERVIRVFDWCANQTFIADTIVVQVGDFSPPSFSGNMLPLQEGLLDNTNPGAPTIIVDRDSLIQLFETNHVTSLSTGPFDCTASFATDLNLLKNQFGFDIHDCQLSDIGISIWNYGPRISHEFPLGDTTWRKTNYLDNRGSAVGLPIGVYALILDVSDGCYNQAAGVVFFTIEDQITPTMMCDDNINVSLSNAGYAKVYTSDIDEGSYDLCQMGGIQVRRSISEDCIQSGLFSQEDLIEEDGLYYTPWRDYVEFFCCDLLDAPIVEVQGYDLAVNPLTGLPSNNVNTCWASLHLDDKLDPQCSNLSAVTTDCNDPMLHDLSHFGIPEMPISSCNNMITEELSPIIDLDRCGFGTITRQFKTIKNKGTNVEEQSEICTQIISVVQKHDYWVSFPADQSANCGSEVAITGVSFSEKACDLIAVSQYDETFFATEDPNACYKIFRTYQIINWCEYDGEAEPTLISRDWDRWHDTNPQQPDGDNQPGDEPIFVHVKINYADNAPDTVYYDNNDNPYDESVTNNNQTYGYWWRVISGSANPDEEDYYEGNGSVWSNDGNQNDSDISGNTQGDDTDARYGSFGYFQYTQHIVVYDDTDPELTIMGADTFCSYDNNDCVGEINFSVAATDLCTSDELDLTIRIQLDLLNDGIIDEDVSDELVLDQFNGRYPFGEHRFLITADDGCGNTVQQDYVFTIIDCKAPTPIVRNVISIELTRDDQDSTGASAFVWAEDYLASPVFDCSGQGEDGEVTHFSINRKGDLPNPNQDSIYVNCSEAVQTIEVEIHAWDLFGNHDFVNAYLLVQDNLGSCDQTAGEGQITGSVFTSGGDPVNEVEIILSGRNPAMYVTNATGTYAFSGLYEGLDFTIIPKKNTFHENGVSTFDLILIQKHILGMQLLESPYQLVAADINNSRSITTMDLIQLRKLVLNLTSEFSNNTSWRFIDSEYAFNSPEAVFETTLPEAKNLNNLEGEETANFVAVKIGDVNGSALAYVQPRSDQPYTINHSGPSIIAPSESIIVSFNKSELTPISGLQFTLQWNPRAIEIIDYLPGLISKEEMGWHTDSGEITISWINLQDKIGDKETLFRLELRNKQKSDLLLRNIFTLSDRLTKCEAYHQETDEIMPILLSNSGIPSKQKVELINQPNPFSTETEICFSLPKKTKGKITIKDSAGKIIKKIESQFDMGPNRIPISKKELSGPGVYYYSLETQNNLITKRMLLLN